MLSLTLMIRERLIVKISNLNPLFITTIIYISIIVVPFGINKTAESKNAKNFDVIYESESLYGKIKVVDDDRYGVRWLISDSSTIGGKFIKTSYPVYPFLYILESARLFNPAAEKALLIGLGAGYLPRALKKHNIITDVIEIDSKVAFAAQKYFDFKPMGKLIIGDARFHIKNLNEKYDFIIHDTFTGGAVPSHLLSIEMIHDLKSLLNDGGIFALVYFGFSKGEQATAAASIHKTINSVFPFVKVYVSKADTEPVDLIFVTSMDSLKFHAPSAKNYSDKMALKMLHSMESLERRLAVNQGFVITDDLNPLESLQTRKAEAYRANVVELIGSNILLE